MSCPSRIPSYEELALLQNRINSLEQQIRNKPDKSLLNIIGDNLGDLRTAVNGVNVANNSIRDELNALGNLGSLIPRTINDILNRRPATVSPSEVAELRNRLSTVERFVEEYRRDKNSGLYATRSELEALRRDMVQKSYVDSRDAELRSALERLISNAESQINGLNREFRAEVEERRRITRQLGDAVENAKNTANKALETAQNLYSKSVGYVDTKTKSVRDELSKKIDSVSNSVNKKVDDLKGEINQLRAKSFLIDKAIAGLTATVAVLSATVAWLTGGGLAVFISTAVLELMQTLGFQRQINQLSQKMQSQEVRIFGVENLVRLKVNEINALVNNLPNFDPTFINQKLNVITGQLSTALTIANQAKSEALEANAQSLKNAILLSSLQGLVLGVTATLGGRIISTVLNRFPWVGSPMNSTRTIIERQPIIQPTRETVIERVRVERIPVTTERVINNNNVIERQPQNFYVTNPTRETVIQTNTVRENVRVVTVPTASGNSKTSAPVDYNRIEQINRRVASETNARVDGVQGFLATRISPKLEAIGNQLQQFQNSVFTKFTQTWEFLKLDRVLNIIGTAASVHNASMISVNLIRSLISSVDGLIGMVGLKDAEGNPFSLSSQIGGGMRSLINAVIGEEAAQNLSQEWNQLNRIIAAGSALALSLQSVYYALGEGIEIISDQVAKIGNGLKDNGSVSDRQWPWMKEGIKVQQFNKLDKFINGLESAETVTNNVYATVGAGMEIADSLASVKATKEAFDQEVDQAINEGEANFDNRNTESESPEIAPSDLIRVEEDELT